MEILGSFIIIKTSKILWNNKINNCFTELPLIIANIIQIMIKFVSSQILLKHDKFVFR